MRKIEEILYRKFVLYGYRKVTAALRRKGYVINHKKVYRLMRERPAFKGTVEGEGAKEERDSSRRS